MVELRKKPFQNAYGGSIQTVAGLMRFVFLPVSGMIDAERFSMYPTLRINFKRGPDPTDG